MLIRCREAHHLLSRQRDGALTMRERVVLRIHLMGCDACSIVRRNFAFLSKAVRRMDETDE